MAKARILLTGGRGMVGRNILEHPLAGQWDFIAPGSHELDLTDFAATRRFMAQVKPDAVIHSAGRVGGIQANMAHPVDFLVTNVDLGRNVILAAREAGVSKLLNLASSCMYPRHAANPLHAAPRAPRRVAGCTRGPAERRRACRSGATFPVIPMVAMMAAATK